MQLLSVVFCLLLFIGNKALAQSPEKTNKKTEQKKDKMDTSKLTNSIVKAAFDAWQKGDSKAFTSYFTGDAKLFDDGNPRDLNKFIKEACGHERFTSINKVENNGLDIFGNFHTESWGDFKTYFKFHLNNEGKITRLDIGQANF